MNAFLFVVLAYTSSTFTAVPTPAQQTCKLLGEYGQSLMFMRQSGISKHNVEGLLKVEYPQADREQLTELIDEVYTSPQVESKHRQLASQQYGSLVEYRCLVETNQGE